MPFYNGDGNCDHGDEDDAGDGPDAEDEDDAGDSPDAEGGR